MLSAHSQDALCEAEWKSLQKAWAGGELGCGACSNRPAQTQNWGGLPGAPLEQGLPLR